MLREGVEARSSEQGRVHHLSSSSGTDKEGI